MEPLPALSIFCHISGDENCPPDVNIDAIRRRAPETGGIFMIPTYLFIFYLLGTIAIGLAKTLAAGGHPAPVVPSAKL